MKLLSLLLLLSISATAQIKFPVGYTVQKNMEGSPNEIRTDFNGDGKQDVFAVINKGEDTKLFAAVSNAKGAYVVSTHSTLNFFDCCNRIELKGNIVKVFSNGMRYFENYTFRYNKTNFGFDVIGFDSESFGNAVHEGAGARSLNLITGDYISIHQEVDINNPENYDVVQKKKKLKLPKKYTLKNFNELLLYLEKLTSN
jgi:hypothetical protein